MKLQSWITKQGSTPVKGLTKTNFNKELFNDHPLSKMLEHRFRELQTRLANDTFAGKGKDAKALIESHMGLYFTLENLAKLDEAIPFLEEITFIEAIRRIPAFISSTLDKVDHRSFLKPVRPERHPFYTRILNGFFDDQGNTKPSVGFESTNVSEVWQQIRELNRIFLSINGSVKLRFDVCFFAAIERILSFYVTIRYYQKAQQLLFKHSPEHEPLPSAQWTKNEKVAFFAVMFHHLKLGVSNEKKIDFISTFLGFGKPTTEKRYYRLFLTDGDYPNESEKKFFIKKLEAMELHGMATIAKKIEKNGKIRD